MKIIKGERLLPAWIRAEVRPVLVFTGAGSALWAGSVVLVRRGWDELGEHLDRWERLGALAVAGYVAGHGCWQAPHIAQFAIPGVVIAWCLAAWWTAPAGPGEEPTSDEPDPQDVADLVRDLIGDDRGILLTTLRAPLQAADTRAVRELLHTAGIRVRPGVRAAAGNGPGVHRDDLPAPSPPPEEAPVGDVAAGETANTNNNNALRVESREGMTIINDPADRHRTHSLKKP